MYMCDILADTVHRHSLHCSQAHVIQTVHGSRCSNTHLAWPLTFSDVAPPALWVNNTMCTQTHTLNYSEPQRLTVISENSTGCALLTLQWYLDSPWACISWCLYTATDWLQVTSVRGRREVNWPDSRDDLWTKKTGKRPEVWKRWA